MLLLAAPSTKKLKVTGKGLPFGTSHSIETVEGSVVAKLFGKESQVNSVHRQSIKDLASDFRATAIDPRDQTIEAIESIDEHRIIGLQWHPEFLVNERRRQFRTI